MELMMHGSLGPWRWQQCSTSSHTDILKQAPPQCWSEQEELWKGGRGGSWPKPPVSGWADPHSSSGRAGSLGSSADAFCVVCMKRIISGHLGWGEKGFIPQEINCDLLGSAKERKRRLQEWVGFRAGVCGISSGLLLTACSLTSAGKQWGRCFCC